MHLRHLTLLSHLGPIKSRPHIKCRRQQRMFPVVAHILAGHARTYACMHAGGLLDDQEWKRDAHRSKGPRHHKHEGIGRWDVEEHGCRQDRTRRRPHQTLLQKGELHYALQARDDRFTGFEFHLTMNLQVRTIRMLASDRKKKDMLDHI